MTDLYTSGDYLAATRTWHAEDSPWKAQQIRRLIAKHRLRPATIAEVGCGAGVILHELSKAPEFDQVTFEGYDVSPQAIDLAMQKSTKNLTYFLQDPLEKDNRKQFEVLLVIDVFEHVADYMGFLQQCQRKAKLKIFHIPLDLHVSAVLRGSFTRTRYTIGHLHYFTAESAICALQDTGHEIVDYVYTDPSLSLYKTHPSVRRALANIPRWLVGAISIRISARLFGGYSLLVLAR